MALFDRGIQVDAKKHLTLILVGQQEESDDGLEGDLVVEGFAVQMNKGGEEFDVVSTTRRQGVNLSAQRKC